MIHRLRAAPLPKSRRWLIGAALPLLLNLSACSSTVTSTEWAQPYDIPGEFSTQDDSRNGWSNKIADLPIELHGALPDESSITTAALLPHVAGESAANGLGLAATQRVVLYIDGLEVPERADFCAVSKRYRSAPRKDNTMALRAALCDGPRIVSYARKFVDLDDFKATDLGREVSHLERSLTLALFPPFNLLDANDN